jgi:hypothetical protein
VLTFFSLISDGLGSVIDLNMPHTFMNRKTYELVAVLQFYFRKSDRANNLPVLNMFSCIEIG